jgi:hypothetical protein
LFIINNLYTGKKRQGSGGGLWRIRTTANEPVWIRKEDKDGGKSPPSLKRTEKPCFPGFFPQNRLFKQGFARLQTGKKGFFAIVRMKNYFREFHFKTAKPP